MVHEHLNLDTDDQSSLHKDVSVELHGCVREALLLARCAHCMQSCPRGRALLAWRWVSSHHYGDVCGAWLSSQRGTIASTPMHVQRVCSHGTHTKSFLPVVAILRQPCSI